MNNRIRKTVPTSTHWGNYKIEVEDDQIKRVLPYDSDHTPSPLAHSLNDALDINARIPQPMVRAGYLEDGPNSDRAQRGREPFVPVTWETAFELVANELKRVAQEHGNEAIYAGSYGWSSPGTLHFARWNMHRLLNLNGGFTHSIGSYSTAAAEAITRYILAPNGEMVYDAPSWQDIAEHTELAVLFGGTRVNNAQVSFGGLGGHTQVSGMQAAFEAGVNFINIGPIQDDVSLEVWGRVDCTSA